MSDSTDNHLPDNHLPDNSGISPEMPLELRRALDGWAEPLPSPAFRLWQRRAFMAAGKAGLPITEKEALERLASWENEPAREEFRRDLRGQFLAAAVAHREGQPSEPDGASDRPVMELALRGATHNKVLSFPRLAGGLLAAAAALLLFFNLRPQSDRVFLPDVDLGSTQGWQAVNLLQGASFTLDGVQLLSTDAARLGTALTNGDCALSTGSDNLVMVDYAEGVLVEFPPETDLHFLPRNPEEPDLIEIKVLKGGMRVATTEAFQGRILVHTPHTSIALTTDSMGIDVFEEGTCLCMLGGSAELIPNKNVEDGNGCAEAYTAGAHSCTFVKACGTVEKAADGKMHHADEMERFSQLSGKYLY